MIIDKKFIYILFFFILFYSSSLSQIYNFRQFSLEEGLSQSQVFDICQDQTGNIWFGTYGGGITIWNGIQIKYLSIGDGLPSYSIIALLSSQNGNIWIGTENGIALYNGIEIIDIDPEKKNKQ